MNLMKLLINDTYLNLLYLFSIFIISYLITIFGIKLIKKTKIYNIVFINKILDSIEGWIFPILLNIFILYFFFFIFVNQKLFKIFVITLIIMFGLILTKFIGRLMYHYSHIIDKNVSSSIIVNLIRVIFFIIILLMALDYMGITIVPILTSFGLAGLAISLALNSTLSNLFAGLQIITNKIIKIGDYIQLKDGFEGTVEDIKWHSLIIRERSNNIVIIPNSMITNTIVRNYYPTPPELNITLKIGVSYDSDLEKVEKLTIEIAKEVINELDPEAKDYIPIIRFESFGLYSIEFNLIVRISNYNKRSVILHELIKRIHREYKKNSIDIPYPITTVMLKKEY